MADECLDGKLIGHLFYCVNCYSKKTSITYSLFYFSQYPKFVTKTEWNSPFVYLKGFSVEYTHMDSTTDVSSEETEALRMYCVSPEHTVTLSVEHNG